MSGVYSTVKQGNGYNYSKENLQQVTKANRSIVTGMDDGGASERAKQAVINPENLDLNSFAFKNLMHSHNLYGRKEIDLYNKTYRFGVFNPYGAVSTTREFLFFTKPDLNIIARDEITGGIEAGYPLTEALQNIPYWIDLRKHRARTIEALQLSVSPRDNFIHLLQNQCISNLEIPGLAAETIETPTNMYGVGFSYRGSSEASDDSYDFSLEFKDGKWLDIYYFFKTYEEYQTLKHHGVVAPHIKYIQDKVLHDQISIYKFLVDEDMETIIYYAKFYGVMPKSLPRDVFSNATFDNGLSYSIDFRAAFFEDLRPEIIYDFNSISRDFYNSQRYQIDIYNECFGRSDNRPATAAYIEKCPSNNSPNGFVYKLRWRGGDPI